MRILVDTNILISAVLFPRSLVAKTLLYITDNHSMVLCDQNIAELREVLQRKRPDKLPEQPIVVLGRYAQMRKSYLLHHHKVIYYNYLTSGTLVQHLAETEQRAMEMEDRLLTQMAQQEGVTEKLKAENPLKWTRLMNNLRNSAQEIVKAQVIFA